MTFVSISNVYAITSNEVMYDNNGTNEKLTESLDLLYGELKKYKTGGSVEANQMLEGATGYSKGVLVTGTIKSKGATTYTPGTSNQTIALGQYLSGTQTIRGDTNLVSGNIAKGKSIFGVEGSYTSDANAGAAQILSGYTAYVNGNKITGTHTSKNHNVEKLYMYTVPSGGSSTDCLISQSISSPWTGKLLVVYNGTTGSGNMASEWRHGLTVNGIAQTATFSDHGNYQGFEYYVVDVNAGESVSLYFRVVGSDVNIRRSCGVAAYVFT